MESVLGRYRNLTILVGVLFLQVLGLAVQVKRSGDAENMAALAIDLARDAGARVRMGCVARKFYNDRFALSHTIAALRGA